MLKRISFFCIVGLVTGSSYAQPVNRAGSQLVQVDVLVRTDKAPVKGLTKSDFTISDKGKNQEIAVFYVTDKPNAPPTALPPGVVSNRITSTGAPVQSATIVLFDRLNTQDFGPQAIARKHILTLLTSLKPGERVALYSLFDQITVVQEFTESSDALIEAARHLNASSDALAATPASPLEATLQKAMMPTQPIDSPARVQITNATFRAIALRLGGVPGRKNLIWVTASVPLTYGSGSERRLNDQAEVDNYGRILSDANIALYPIDPRGAGSSFNEVNGRTAGAAEGKTLAGPTNAVNQSSNSLGGTQGLEMIADATGGKAFINVNDISIPLREIMDYSEPAYTLGFYVDEKALDGKKHDLSVKIANKPETKGAKAYFRKSYMAVSRQALAPPSIVNVTQQGVDATSIGLMAVAFPDPAKPGTHAVQVRVTASELQFEHKGDKWVASFDQALSIVDAAGRQSNPSVKTMNLSLTDDQLKQVLAGGVDTENSVPTPEQPYRVRVVVMDKNSGAAGSVRVPMSK